MAERLDYNLLIGQVRFTYIEMKNQRDILLLLCHIDIPVFFFFIFRFIDLYEMGTLLTLPGLMLLFFLINESSKFLIEQIFSTLKYLHRKCFYTLYAFYWYMKLTENNMSLVRHQTRIYTGRPVLKKRIG